MRIERWWLLVVVAAVVGAAGWYFTRPKPVDVALATAEPGVVERTVANTRAATVTACRRAKLAPPTGGQIAKLRVRKGDRVKQDQVLLELWSEDLRAQVQLAHDQLSATQARADQACLSADLAQRDAKRAEQLRTERFISEEALDKAISQAKAQHAACTAANADIAQARSNVEVARANLSRHELRAPFDGVVAEVTGELGEFTTPSPPGIPTPPAIDLIDDRCMYVTAPIDEVDVARVRVGQKAFITIEALPGQRFPARVRRIAPYVLDLEKQARTVDVEVELANPEDVKQLLVGYSADAEIVLEEKTSVVRVPTPAIIEGNRVLVLEDGVLREQQLQTGIANWEHTEVRSGVREGQKVVVSVEREGVVAGAKAVAEPSRKR